MKKELKRCQSLYFCWLALFLVERLLVICLFHLKEVLVDLLLCKDWSITFEFLELTDVIAIRNLSRCALQLQLCFPFSFCKAINFRLSFWLLRKSLLFHWRFHIYTLVYCCVNLNLFNIGFSKGCTLSSTAAWSSSLDASQGFYHLIELIIMSLLCTNQLRQCTPDDCVILLEFPVPFLLTHATYVPFCR